MWLACEQWVVNDRRESLSVGSMSFGGDIKTQTFRGTDQSSFDCCALLLFACVDGARSGNLPCPFVPAFFCFGNIKPVTSASVTLIAKHSVSHKCFIRKRA